MPSREDPARLSDTDGKIAILHYTTADIPPEERHSVWVKRDWPRQAIVYHTQPTEPFATWSDTVMLGEIGFAYTEITGQRYERTVQDIRNSDFDPIVLNLMLEGVAQGDMDGRAFRESSGMAIFHDLGRPSVHVSTASRTFAVIVPRAVAIKWCGPIFDLHGRTLNAQQAAMLIAHALQVQAALPTLLTSAADGLGRVFMELFTIAVRAALQNAPPLPTADQTLLKRAGEEIEKRLGSGDISVAALCTVLNVSRTRLFRAFGGDKGVRQYIIGMRLERTRAALSDIERNERIGDIAHRLGFSDASHLSRAFRQRFGMTPREYRTLVAASQEI